MEILKIKSIRRTAIIELALMLGGLLFIDHFFGNGDRFYNSQYHPFWVPVLVITVQYGSSEGILAAGLSTLALLFHNMPQHYAGEDLFMYKERISFTPLLWLCAAVILGEISMRHRNGRKEAEQTLIQSQKMEESIARAYQIIEREKRSLERRIAGLTNSPAQLMQAISQCDLKEPVKVLQGANNLVQCLIHPMKHSLYLKNPLGLELVASHGWSAPEEFTTLYTKDTPLFNHIVNLEKQLCVNISTEEKLLASQGILACPIRNPWHDQEIIGMLKIESMDLWDLHTSTRAAFKLIADWIGYTYGAAIRLSVPRLVIHGKTHNIAQVTPINGRQQEKNVVGIDP